MRIADRLSAVFVLAVLLAGVGVISWRLTGAPSERGPGRVAIPVLSDQGQAGRTAFDASCAACHGTNGIVIKRHSM